jgi:hypothetical protein
MNWLKDIFWQIYETWEGKEYKCIQVGDFEQSTSTEIQWNVSLNIKIYTKFKIHKNCITSPDMFLR